MGVKYETKHFKAEKYSFAGSDNRTSFVNYAYNNSVTTVNTESMMLYMGFVVFSALLCRYTVDINFDWLIRFIENNTYAIVAYTLLISTVVCCFIVDAGISCAMFSIRSYSLYFSLDIILLKIRIYEIQG